MNKVNVSQITATTYLNKTSSLSVGGGIGQPDPNLHKTSVDSLTVSDDIVTLSVGGGIGQPAPLMANNDTYGNISISV